METLIYIFLLVEILLVLFFAISFRDSPKIIFS